MIKRRILILFFLILFFTYSGSCQILNGDFSYGGGIEHWTPSTTGNASQVVADIVGVSYPGGSPPSMSIKVVCLTDPEYGIAKAYQIVDVTGYSKLAFHAEMSKSAGGVVEASIGSTTQSFSDSSSAWDYYELNIIGTGNQTVQFYTSKTGTGNAIIAVDHIYLIPHPTLSGYVTDENNNPIQSATVSLSDSAGEDVTNETGYYEISLVPTGTYTISAVATNYERYSGTVIISSDTTQNITMTLSTDDPDVWIPLPIYPPTPTPTEIPDDNETTIIEEIIEPIKDIIDEIIEPILELLPEELVEIIEETITYISTPFNWLVLITAYIGAFIGKSIFNNDEDYAEIITSTLLLGTIGWIIVLLINFFIPIISQNEIISILIFTTSGFIIAAIASSIQPETETRTPRRPHR